MVGRSDIDVAISKDMIKKENEEETNSVIDDQWLKKWTECKDIKEEVKFADECRVKLMAIKDDNNVDVEKQERVEDENIV